MWGRGVAHGPQHMFGGQSSIFGPFIVLHLVLSQGLLPAMYQASWHVGVCRFSHLTRGVLGLQAHGSRFYVGSVRLNSRPQVF